MSEAELKAIEAWHSAEARASSSAQTKRGVVSLVAEVRRLRAVIAMGEHRGQHCDWCGAWRKPSAADKDPHAADCPAFTSSGDVR